MLLQRVRLTSGDQRFGLGLDGVVFRQLVLALLAAAVAEVVLLRLGTRVGVHLPKGPIAADALAGASFAGAFALNLASILVTLLVAVAMVAAARRTRSPLVRWSLVALTGAMFSGLGMTLVTASQTADAIFGASTTLLVALLATIFAARGGLSARARVALAVIAAAYMAHQYYALGYLAYQLMGRAVEPPTAMAALRLGELLVVLGGVVAFWAWGATRWRRVRPAGAAFVAVPVVILFAGSLAPAATTSILALWTTGLSLYLPLPLYLLALALYLLTIAACWQSRDGRWVSAGLLFVLLAGYMPEATYEHLLLVLGVALLAGGAAPFAAAQEGSERPCVAT